MKCLACLAIILGLGALVPGQSALLPLSDTSFDSAGVRIRYVDAGTGDPLVLVHGLLGNVESNWRDTGVLDRLTPHFRVIALDLRGHGLSAKPHEPAAYGPKMSEDVVRLLDYLRIPKAHILGYSLGGAVVGKLLTTHPDRFATATFGGSAPWILWTDQDDHQAEESAREFERGSLRARLLRSVPPGQTLSEEEVERRSAKALEGHDRVAIAAVVRSYRRLTVTEQEVAGQRIPLLAVIGSEDTANMRDVDVLKRIRPDLQLVVIDGATHNEPRNARARSELTDAVRRFVAEHSLAAGRPAR